MTSSTSHSVFRNAALASGLLSQQQLDDALGGLARENAAPGHALAVDALSDELLGQRLVDLGYLNRWQVEQLKEGRTKFTLGPYRIVNAIGQGGMGHVFKAEHKLLGRIEAIKVLPKARSTPDAIAAFQREIRAQAQLDHPNLVRVSYADFEGDTYFFVTEYVPGTDLRKLVRRNGPLSYSTAATIVSQAAEGLHYAHRRGLVHRDVKPGNLLVTPDGRTKITDLGLAWFLMDELEAGKIVAGRSKSLVGTADYLAPETIREPDKILPVSDVYALGCTLYYSVTGKVPFPGGNTPDKIRRHLDETPLNPLHFNPDLPTGFCDAIAAMMDKNPDTRTPTAAAVVELLRPWCDESATRHLAESAPGSGIFHRGSAPAPQAKGQLDETASFVLDDLDFVAGQVESPSQISQGTVSVASELEDTLAGVPAIRRVTAARPTTPPIVATSSSRRWPRVLVGVAIAVIAVTAWAAWHWHLF
ncbi:MAG TPA: serine/threonine-protein kinase [Lacipirellulaceae bacterium]|jgi:serine/threonine protein kinase|nr:serine/threonine-protein kinase [Lacipirellulaceae bacterium]